MTNREVLKKFILQAFNIEIKDDFVIECNDIFCPESPFDKCGECPGQRAWSNGFWDKEFIKDEPTTMALEDQKEESNEVTAFTSGEISW